MNITIPDALTVIIPLMVTALSHYLRDSKLSPMVNGLIALGAILITAVACVLLSTGWTGDFRTFTVAVLLFVGLLAHNDFQAVMSWLFVTPSPVAPATTATTANAPASPAQTL